MAEQEGTREHLPMIVLSNLDRFKMASDCHFGQTRMLKLCLKPTSMQDCMHKRAEKSCGNLVMSTYCAFLLMSS